MIPAISAALDIIVGNAVNLQNANGAGRAYELYMMTAIAERLLATGAQVRIKRSDGSFVLPTDTNRGFVQRGGGPSGIPGASQGPGNMSTISFRLSGSAREWEIWNGVQFNGRSGGQHEFDIAIVSSHTADTLRATPTGGSPFGRPAVAIECKDVASAGSVDEMRALVARLYDVTALIGHGPYLSWASSPMSSIHPGQAHLEPARTSFRESNMNSYSAIIRKTGFTSGATAVSGYYFIHPFADVFLGSAQETAFLDNLINWIECNLA